MKGLKQIVNVAAQTMQNRPETDVTFGAWRYGLNTVLPDYQIDMEELAAAVNVMPTKFGGKWGTRPGMKKQTSTAAGKSPRFHRFVNIGGTVRDLLIASPSSSTYLYYNNSGVWTQIGTRKISGYTPYIFPYKGVALICDGDYLKYCDGVGATGLKLAYDSGDGTNGNQFDYLTADSDTFLALGNGTNIGVAQKFTSQSWDAGYTIPPTRFSVNLSANGAPNASAITMKLRLASDASVLATKTLLADASTLLGENTYYAEFTSSDITTEMSPSTAYLITVEHTGGDASNYVKVHCNNIGSGGLAYYGDTDLSVIGNWNADTAKNVISQLRPGRPPKCTAGEVFAERPWLIGSSDKPGGAFVGNFTYLDWSSTNYAGFVPVVDDDTNSFEPGAIIALYKQLYFFGTADQPYIAELEGDTFDTYEINQTFQRQWTNQFLVQNTVNDIWYASSQGVDSLTGVQEFGDLRTEKYSDQIKDRIDDYFYNTGISPIQTPISAYNPADGQYFLQPDGYHRMLVFNIAAKIAKDESGTSFRVPACEYEFCVGRLSDGLVYATHDSGSGTNEYYFTLLAGGDPAFQVIPSDLLLGDRLLTGGVVGSLNDHEWAYDDNDALGYSTVYYRDDSGDIDATGLELRALANPMTITEYDGEMYFCFYGGHEFKLDLDEYKDFDINQYFVDLRTKYVAGKFTSMNLAKQQCDIESEYGCRFNLEVYTEGVHATATATTAYRIAPDDRLIAADFSGIDAVDDVFTPGEAKQPVWKNLEVNASMFQARITDMQLSGTRAWISNIAFLLRKLEV